MADLQAVKNSLIGLTYEEKIEMSEWIHTQIDFERGKYLKQKEKEISEKIANFTEKAARITKSGASSLRDAFNQATDNNA